MLKLLLILLISVIGYANSCWYFDGNDYMVLDFPDITATGYTVLGSGLKVNNTIDRTFAGLETNGTYPYISMQIEKNFSRFRLLISQSGAGYYIAQITTAVPNNTWIFLAGIEVANNNRRTIYNSEVSVTATTALNLLNFNSLRIGARSSSLSNKWYGYIVGITVYNIALSNEQANEIYLGTCPLLIAANNVKFYMYLTELKDRAGGKTITNSGATVSTASGHKLFFTNGGN